jgi:uncharacterized protein (DUF58 family)
MPFVFTGAFLVLLGAALLPLSLAWVDPNFLWVALGYDIALIAAAVADWRVSEDWQALQVERITDDRFSIGADNRVTVRVSSLASRKLKVRLRDEYPDRMRLVGVRDALVELPAGGHAEFGYDLHPTARGHYEFGKVVGRIRGRLGLVWMHTSWPLEAGIRVYPNIHEARKAELYAHRSRQLKLGLRRVRYRGQGREFESLRDFVVGDEVRHLSWSATARRGKLITRQYQVERSQNVLVMLDTGRLMTARIGELTKLDHAINAVLSIAHVALSGGDNVGLLTFGRQVITYVPPKHRGDQLWKLLEALYAVEPQMIEPSYARAFNYLHTNWRRRSLVVILTDLVDPEASAELLSHTRLLIPRHLPLIVTIGDSDLRAVVRETPANADQVYRQSVAEELLRQREEALRRITHAGGLALDVPTGALAFELVSKYLQVKERGQL